MVTEDQVKRVCLDLQGDLLKKKYKDEWSEENPTLGYCYMVSEALYHFVDGKVDAYCISLKNGTHWFVRVDGEIVDLTAEQFNYDVDYMSGVRKGFFKGSVETGRGFISKNGYEMAKRLEIV